MMITLQVQDIHAALELENAILLDILDIDRQLDALGNRNTRYAIHRRQLLQSRRQMLETWKQSVIRQSQPMCTV